MALSLAINHEQELQQAYRRIALDPFYRFYTYEWGPRYELEIERSAWAKMQFVSLSPSGEVIGYIAACVSREANHITSFQVVSFTPNSAIVMRDAAVALRDCFEKHGFQKVCFCVVVGNPAESLWDRAVKRCGGRIVGTFRREVRLFDGQLYDTKYYEITLEEWKASRK